MVLATLATLVAAVLAWWEYRRTRELFTPWMLFLGYAALDVFLPAAVFLLTEPPALASWIVPLRKADIASSTLVYVMSLVFFATFYFFASRDRSDDSGTAWAALADVKLKLGHLYAGLAVAGGWYVLHQLTLVSEAGSFDAYLADKFRERFRPDIYASTNLFDFVFNQFASAMLPLFLVLVGILFFFRYRYERRVLWGWLLPAVAWILTLSTFYRGYQLNLFLSLAFIETCRHRVAKLRPEAGLGRTEPTRARTALTFRSKVLATVAVVLFVLYGAFRQYNSSFQYGKPVSFTTALTSQGGELLQGWGVIGLTSILHFYPERQDHLGGNSVVTTFFMPVPRPFWPGKPERYGAEEVTRLMGWPITTQSAISMPGELYANFGLVGIPLVGAFGFLFRTIYRRRLHPKLFFVYAFFVPYSVLLTHWMSSTGFMTSVTQYAPSVGVALLVLGFRDTAAGTIGHRGNTATGEGSSLTHLGSAR
jgi:oligosaccharide repeat unit polymerase